LPGPLLGRAPPPYTCFDSAGVDLRDPGIPVGEHRTGASAAGAGRQPRAQVARLADVLRGEPDVVPVDHGRAVVAPARTRGVGSVEDGGSTEAIRRAETLGGELDGADAPGVDRGEGRTRVKVPTDERQGHHAVAAWRHGDGGVDDAPITPLLEQACGHGLAGATQGLGIVASSASARNY